MRPLLALAPLACVAACAAGSRSSDVPGDQSLHERLARATRFLVARDASGGEISARRRGHDGWIEGTAALGVETGELTLSVADEGLSLGALALQLAPITLPDELFGTRAELTDITLSSAGAAVGPVDWESDVEVSARVALALELSWTITVDGGETPALTVRLPPIDVNVSLAGSGDRVDAAVDLAATGELWSWAGILELTHIELALAASPS